MSATSYTGLGTTINVRAAGSTTSVGFNQNVVLVGGYDAENGDATAGEVEYVADGVAAESLFGEGSELARQFQLARLNGAGEVYGVAVEESSGSDEFDSSTSGSLENAPVFDPNIHDEHEITVEDGDGDTVDVTISYEDELSSPDEGVAVNPVTGDVEFSSVGTYTVDYEYGDYDSAIRTAAKENVRFVIVYSEASGVKSTLGAELEGEATDVRLKRGITGGRPGIDSGDASEYEPDLDNQRVIEVVPARGQTADGEQRTLGAVGGAYSAQPLGESLTYDSIDGFDSLNDLYRPSQARDFDRVTALTDNHEVVEGVTTSSEDAFSDVYQCEIVDTVVQGLYQVGRSYAGGPNTVDDRDNLGTDARNMLSNYARQRPPLLSSADGSTPYSVETELGASDDEVAMNVGVDPLDVMKEVTINMNVGTVVTFEGAEV